MKKGAKGIKVADKTMGRRKAVVDSVPLVEFQQLKTKHSTLQKEIANLRSDHLSAEKIMNSLKAGMRALPMVRVSPHKPSKFKDDHEEDQILLFSDIHAGEIIESAEIDGFNEYNFEVMAKRLWKLQERVLALKDLQEKSFKIKRLHIASLGDMITGEIHSMAETNELPLVGTMQQTALIIAQMLMKFASAYDEVIYIGVGGNHDRRHEKPRTKQAYDNWGTMVNWCISLLCSNQKNIEFRIPKSPFTVEEIRGWKWLMRHGHGKTNSFAGIPYYGLSRKHSALQELYRKRGGFDYECMGHYHQQAVLKDDRVYINGSVVGANEFAVNELAAFSPPSQKLIGIDDKHGVTYTYRVMLDDAPEHQFVFDPEKVFEHRAQMSDFINTQFDSKRR